MSNWLECSECHVGCKPHEDWCPTLRHDSETERYRVLEAEAKALDELVAASGQVIFRGPGNPWYDAQMREWERRRLPRSNVQSVPGRMSFTVLERGRE